MDITHRLLRSHCYSPHVPDGYVARAELLTRLEHNLSFPLTIVSAPAGYGKSTTISHALQSLDRRYAWYDVHPQDSQLYLFWAYIIYAIQQCFPEFGVSLLEQIGEQAEDTLASDLWLDTLNREFEDLPAPLILAIDDYHHITDTDINNGIQRLITHLSSKIRLVILTRNQPPFEWHTLREKQVVAELAQDDLRFMPGAIEQFFSQGKGIELDHAIIERISQKTEGWIIALQLLCMTMGHFRDPFDQLVRNLDGTTPGIFEYLAEEVIADLPPDTKDFLFQTGALGTFTVDLSNHLLHIDNSDLMIKQLVQHNLFVIPLDIEGQHYRYHHLFADFLRAHLTPEQQHQIHRDAAAWYAAHQMYAEAVDHALGTDDLNIITPLVNDATFHMLNRRKFDTIFRWFEHIPTTAVRNNPELTVARTWSYVIPGKLAEATKWLAHAQTLAIDSTHSRHLYYQLQICTGILDYAQTHFSHAQAILNALLPDLDDLNPILKFTALTLLCGIHYFDSDFKRTCELMQPHIDQLWDDEAGIVHLYVMAKYLRALIHAGELKAAKAVVRHFQSECETNAVWYKHRGMVLCESAQIAFFEHRLEDALEILTETLHLLHEVQNFDVSLNAYYLLSELAAYQGDVESALNYLQPPTQIAQQSILAWIQQENEDVRARIHDLAGDGKQVQAWFDNQDSIPPLRPRSITAAIHHLARQKPPEKAIDTLLAYRRQLEAREVVTGQIVLDLALARLHFEADDEKRGRRRLVHAISAAFQNNYIQPFVEEAAWLAARLPELRMLAPDFVDRVLAFMPEPDSTTFTEREQAILPLLRQGYTNQQIAEELHVSVNTVKYHLKNLYRKLGVQNRTQAVQKLS